MNNECSPGLERTQLPVVKQGQHVTWPSAPVCQIELFIMFGSLSAVIHGGS